MTLFATARWGLLFVICSLSSCQRTIYQRQVAGEIVRQVSVPAPAQESATITMPAPLTPASKGYREAPQHERRMVRQPRRVHRRFLPAPIRASATASTLGRHTHSRPKEAPVLEPVRYRSRGIALLLAVLSLIYLPLSLHNFYLGYYGRGALAIATVLLGTYLVVFAFLGSLFSGVALVGLGLLGLAILAGWFVWQIVDLVRIITKDLKPKNGKYYPQFFQTSPRAGDTPHTD